MERDRSSPPGAVTSFPEFPEESLESQCMEQMAAFREKADLSAFRAFYNMSLPFLDWYAGRLLGKKNEGEKEAVLTRFYAFLCEEALSPMGRMPEENLLGWCKAALANLVELHLQGGMETAGAETGGLAERIRPLPIEIGVRERLRSVPERVEEGIAEVLIRGDAGLSDLERRVLSSFYRNGRDLDRVCQETGLSEELSRRVLSCARGKVYLAYFQGPGRFLPARDDTASAMPEAGEVEG